MTVSGTTIAFIGTGVMGASMAGHLQKAGAKLRVYNRTRAKAAALLSAGAVWADTPAEATRGAHVVCTMVGYPADVEAVYYAADGIFSAAAAGSLLVDFTTSDPALARRIAATAAEKGMSALDAPVSGGDLGARNASLSIMVGGDKAAFAELEPVFALLGKTVVLQGPPGAGQHTKMSNQIAIAGTLSASIEAIIYAEKAGLDPAVVLQSIGGGAAQSWQLQNMVPRMLDGNFEPGFYSKHFLKDLRIALEAARAMNLDLPVLRLAEDFFAKLCDKGYQDKGTQALYLLYKQGLI